MFFKAEGRANLFDMLRRIKTYARQTITRYGTGSVILFDCAERNSLVKQSEQSPLKNWRLLTAFRERVPYRQAHKQRFLMLFALSYGPFSARSLRVMTERE